MAMLLTVQNVGEEKVSYATPTRWMQADFWIEDGTGNVVWVWSYFTRYLPSTADHGSDSLEPGEARAATGIWTQDDCSLSSFPVEPGRYTANAFLAAQDAQWVNTSSGHGIGGWYAEPVPFEIIP